MAGFRWVLAFDGSCCTCQKVSQVVTQACAGRLEVAPLERGEVRAWRERALGPEPAHVPTLLRIDAEGGLDPRAWTGAAMLGQLARHLGPRSGLRVLRALGAATRPLEPGVPVLEPGQAGSALAAEPSVRLVGRKDFLKIAAGAGLAATVLVAGRTPKAFATTGDQQVEAWAVKHARDLPTNYADVVALPHAYRQAVYARTADSVRRGWWSQQLSSYRVHLNDTLTSGQRRALDQAQTYLARTDALTRVDRSELDELSLTFKNAFGRADAKRLIATLQAPTDTTAHPTATTRPDGTPDCTCSRENNWCDVSYCEFSNCIHSGGCGAFWTYECDGVCGNGV